MTFKSKMINEKLTEKGFYDLLKSNPRIKIFRSINSFYDFIKKEIEEWDTLINGSAGHTNSLPTVSNINTYYKAILRFLDDLILSDEKVNKDNSDEVKNQLVIEIEKKIDAMMKNIASYIEKMHVSNSSEYVFINEMIEAKLDNTICNEISNYTLNGTITNISHITPYQNGIDYLIKAATVRNNMLFSELENTKVESFNKSKESFEEEKDNVRLEYEGKLEKFENRIDEKVIYLENYTENTTKEINEDYANYSSKMASLENLYNEKLKLESPAKYWETLRKEYEETGAKWKNAAITTAVIMASLLTLILYNFPQELIDLKPISLESLRATLVLAVIVSIGIYILRLFIKLSISAYHLSRDAKERYQLTYVYLALLKTDEKTVDEKDKHIILNSLFSRADTGLLKGDSSPTLPEGMIAQVLKSVK